MIFGWFKRKPADAQPISFGVPSYDWQPKRLVEVTYSLRKRDEAEWLEFKQRAEDRASFQYLRSYDPLRGEPRREQLDPDVTFWSRVGQELWFLADRDWFGFPDPQQYALLVWNPSKKRLMQFGNFGQLPDTWTLPDALNQ